MPLQLKSTTVQDKDTNIYKKLREYPPYELYTFQYAKAGFGVYVPLRKDNNLLAKIEKDWNVGSDHDVQWTRHFVPQFSNPQVSEDYQGVVWGSYMINDVLLNLHDVGIVIYDVTNKDAITYDVYYNMEPYRDEEYGQYKIELPLLKPNNKYEMYPCVDQKFFGGNNPIPILAEPKYEFMIEVKPVTGEILDIDKGEMAAWCSGSIPEIQRLKLILHKEGIVISTSPDFKQDPLYFGANANEQGYFQTKIKNLNPSTKYYFAAYLKCGEDEVILGETKSFVTPASEEVDLGLSVNWCAHNLGAEYAEDFGHYYAWGEITHKGLYSWDSYFDNPYNAGEWVGCQWNSDIVGTDHDPSPGSWRLPTRAEMDELIKECNWEWTKSNGRMGYLITGPSGASIFLPAGGLVDGKEIKNKETYGSYWTGTINPNSASTAANLLFLNSGTHMLQWSNRFYGRLIRPVCRKSPY